MNERAGLGLFVERISPARADEQESRVYSYIGCQVIQNWNVSSFSLSFNMNLNMQYHFTIDYRS